VFDSLEELRDVCKEHFYTEKGSPSVFALTLEETDFPIRIRSFHAGDKIQMRFGRKEVHRFFIDRHIPQYQRQTWPVVENAAGEIILVPGLGCNVQHYSTMPNLNVIQY
jgi:tRNA(ile)-lysidine synthetase, C-terminal domain